MTPIIIAHRGASGHAPENTFAAFHRALELGFPDIEFDVRATRDGVPVLLHDATLDRTTDGHGRLRDLTLKEVKALDAGRWFGEGLAGERVPTLEEVYAELRERARFQVEIKEAGMGLEVKTLALMARYGVRPRCVISSFAPEVIGEMAPVAGPDLPVRWLVQVLDSRTIDEARRLGAQGVIVHVRAVTPEAVVAAREAGLAVGAWGAETQEDVLRAARAGVDSFTHNEPDRAKGWLEGARTGTAGGGCAT